MFNPDNFYNYLHQYSRSEKLNLDLHPFAVHGNREFFNVAFPFGDDISDIPKYVTGTAAVFDQEPIEMKYFSKWLDYNTKPFEEVNFTEYSTNKENFQKLSSNDFLFRHFSRVSNPLLFHSERNSPEVELFKKNHFHPVHYFYHGLISRDWFRHWKHYNTSTGPDARRLGLYARDASGSRAYRLDLLNGLIPFKNDVHYYTQKPIFNLKPELNNHWPINDTEFDSHSSAHIEIEDCKRFRIQIVPETLFNTKKTHLTEKVFKAIVMKQPFILAGAPGSLSYLKDYGFRTFESLWDESYDTELDPEKRMQKILKVVEYLTRISEQDFNRIMDRAQSIVEHNHKLFFGEAFEAQMLTELHCNIKTALKSRNEEYKTMPGGTYFYYQDLLFKKGVKLKVFFWRNKLIYEYLLEHDPGTAGKILKKYEHLFPRKFINQISLNCGPGSDTVKNNP